ncbi:hypothetical protein AMD26_007890 [Deinococcus sp. UR1]|nr:hypothetical protein AMD26_007890 [Deinococcus sp. UR1]
MSVSVNWENAWARRLYFRPTLMGTGTALSVLSGSIAFQISATLDSLAISNCAICWPFSETVTVSVFMQTL